MSLFHLLPHSSLHFPESFSLARSFTQHWAEEPLRELLQSEPEQIEVGIEVVTEDSGEEESMGETEGRLDNNAGEEIPMEETEEDSCAESEGEDSSEEMAGPDFSDPGSPYSPASSIPSPPASPDSPPPSYESLTSGSTTSLAISDSCSSSSFVSLPSGSSSSFKSFSPCSTSPDPSGKSPSAFHSCLSELLIWEILGITFSRKSGFGTTTHYTLTSSFQNLRRRAYLYRCCRGWNTVCPNGNAWTTVSTGLRGTT